MNALLAEIVLMVTPPEDPNPIKDPNASPLVRPGWTALIVFLLLAAATVFLFFSMRKQLRRVNFDDGTNDVPPATSPQDRGQ